MVTSRDITPTPQAAKKRDWSLELGRYGTLMAITIFGGAAWAIYGGYNVLGLQAITQSFNDAGRVFWAIISLWQINLPKAPSIPASIPAIPWLAVVSASAVQFATVYRKMRDLHIPRWLIIAGLILSAYDFSATYFGLAGLKWLAASPAYVRGVLSAILSLGFEIAFSFILKEIRE